MLFSDPDDHVDYPTVEVPRFSDQYYSQADLLSQGPVESSAHPQSVVDREPIFGTSSATTVDSHYSGLSSGVQRLHNENHALQVSMGELLESNRLLMSSVEELRGTFGSLTKEVSELRGLMSPPAVFSSIKFTHSYHNKQSREKSTEVRWIQVSQ